MTLKSLLSCQTRHLAFTITFYTKHIWVSMLLSQRLLCPFKWLKQVLLNLVACATECGGKSSIGNYSQFCHCRNFMCVCPLSMCTFLSDYVVRFISNEVFEIFLLQMSTLKFYL